MKKTAGLWAKILSLIPFVLGGASLGCTAITDFDKDKIETTERESFVLQYKDEVLVDGFDVLFVVDTTNNADGFAQGLRDSAGAMADMMPEEVGGVGSGSPTLHVGITTTDLGAMGLNNVNGCSPWGDEGRLQSFMPTEDPNCPSEPPAEPYLIIQNNEALNLFYPGTTTPMEMGQALECLIKGLNENAGGGCGFEQPLNAAVEATRNPENDGFLRDNAGLALIFVTNEDDCSASTPALYDPDNPDLGIFSNFRCFEYGVVCDEDTSTLGPKHNCVPNPDDDLLTTLPQIYQDLAVVKAPEKTVVANIVGPVTEIQVINDNLERPEVAVSCSTSEIDGLPAIRLEAFRKLFPRGDLQSSICAPELGDLLYKLSDRMASEAAVRCVPKTPVDTDATTPKMDADCNVYDVINLDQTNEDREGPYPACNMNDPVYPCYNVTPEEICSSGYKFDLMRDAPPTENSQVLAECLVEIEG